MQPIDERFFCTQTIIKNAAISSAIFTLSTIPLQLRKHLLKFNLIHMRGKKFISAEDLKKFVAQSENN
jgi:hypothetical protein